jgi:two-component system KDP operon response regulator KdpE
MDGLETTRRIRQKSTVPIILLTALDEETDKIQAFNIGADDYLTKPFGLGELLGRIKAVMRRAQWGKSPTSNRRIIQGDIIMDLERHEVEVRGKKVSLTPTEYNVLALMISHAGKVLPHSMILKEVWGDEYGGELEYLRVYIGHLRKKIERDPNAPEYLISERGIGYLFNIPKKTTPGY